MPGPRCSSPGFRPRGVWPRHFAMLSAAGMRSAFFSMMAASPSTTMRPNAPSGRSVWARRTLMTIVNPGPTTKQAGSDAMGYSLTGIAIGRGRELGLTRRSLKLLSGDWLPHGDGASEGCLVLAADIGHSARPTLFPMDPSPRPVSPSSAEAAVGPRSGGRCSRRRFKPAREIPHKANQLACDRGDGYVALLSPPDQLAISAVEPQLRLPGNIFGLLRYIGR